MASSMQVATAGEDGVAKIWKIWTEEKDKPPELVCNLTDNGGGRGSPGLEWTGHSAGIQSIRYKPPDEDRLGDTGDEDAEELNKPSLLTASKDKTIKLWTPLTRRSDYRGGGRGGAEEEMWYAETTLPSIEKKITAELSYDQRIKELKSKIASGTPQQLDTVGHSDYVNMATWCTEGRGKGDWILSCSDDKTAIVWNLQRRRSEDAAAAKGIVSQARVARRQAVLHHNQGHTLPVVSARWNPECNKVLTCSYDKSCMIWEPATGKLLKCLPLPGDKEGRHEAAIWSAYWSPDGTDVLTASKDRTARIWDVTKGTCKCVFQHDDLVLHAVYNPRGDQVLTASLDGGARIWDLRQAGGAQAAQEIRKEPDPTKTLGGPRRHPTAHTSAVWHASFGNRDHQSILTCSHDMTALIWDQKRLTKEAHSNEPKSTLAGHTGILWQATFSADDGTVLTCSEDRTARLWDVRTGIPHPPCWVLGGRHSKHNAAVTCGTFMPERDVAP